MCDDSRSQDFKLATQPGDVMPRVVSVNPFLDKPVFLKALNTLSVFTFGLFGWLTLTPR